MRRTVLPLCFALLGCGGGGPATSDDDPDDTLGTLHLTLARDSVAVADSGAVRIRHATGMDTVLRFAMGRGAERTLQVSVPIQSGYSVAALTYGRHPMTQLGEGPVYAILGASVSGVRVDVITPLRLNLARWTLTDFSAPDTIVAGEWTTVAGTIGGAVEGMFEEPGSPYGNEYLWGGLTPWSEWEFTYADWSWPATRDGSQLSATFVVYTGDPLPGPARLYMTFSLAIAVPWRQLGWAPFVSLPPGVAGDALISRPIRNAE